MSRRPAVDLDDSRDARDIDPIRPTRAELAPPADGCDGSPWCSCVDCGRVPAGGFFAFETDRYDDWEPF